MIYTILLLGSKGQLGNSILSVATEKNFKHSFICKDIETLDITKKEAISRFLSEQKVDIIINCAAYTAVDQAEDEAALAYLVNETAVFHLAEIAREKDIYLFHISTDYVFDGTSSVPYQPEDATTPTSVYGKSKLAGEQAMTGSGCHGNVIRTSWLYSPFGHNFVKTILRIGKERSEINVVNDQYGSPTNACDLAMAILTLIDKGNFNTGTEIYHFSNRGIITWHEFAQEIIRLANYDTLVHPISSAEYPTKAKRPHYSAFDLRKIENTLGYSIPEWKESLREIVEKLV
ncbi:MAG: dTDP-4-dehydrorhamnose reductase [Bacteroidales bacterium]|jgi:dTDP-4-dehydrorhamnose reductase|nr:dTDP-4-dehydrorhamnose reductase [Bacteroidales bacterium]